MKQSADQPQFLNLNQWLHINKKMLYVAALDKYYKVIN